MTSKISSDDVTKAFFDIKICEQAWKTPESIRWGKKKNYSTLPGEQGGQAGSKGHLTHRWYYGTCSTFTCHLHWCGAHEEDNKS